MPFQNSIEEKGLLLTAYHRVLKLIPKLKNILPYKVDADAGYLNGIVNVVSSAHIFCDTITYVIQIQEGCNAAHSEVIKRIKEYTIKYLAAGGTPIQVDAQQVQHKALRGFNNHNNIGCFLIPVKDLEEWDVDLDGYVCQIDSVQLSTYTVGHVQCKGHIHLQGSYSIWVEHACVFI